MTTSVSAVLSLLLLADGRFPAGGHAHSAGAEAAVGDGRVRDVASLEAFTLGRLWSVGLTDAALAAATVRTLLVGGPSLAELDAEADARLPVRSLRTASRRLGRQVVRVAARCWPDAVLVDLVDVHPDGAHQPVATGGVAVAAGLDERGAATLVAHHSIATPTQAAVKLLGLDPFEVTALAARLGDEAELVVDAAVTAAEGALAGLPARTSPLLDVAAVEHHGWPVRMFAT